MENSEIIIEIIERVEIELYPQVVLAAKSALAAYDQDTENFGNYTLGCAFWENLSNRLYKQCKLSQFFTATFHKNILEISATLNGQSLSFYAPRVDEITRIPRTAKHIKSILKQGQEFLSIEIEKLLGRKSVYTLGCSLDAASGLGSVTFDQLYPMGGGNFEAKTLATFGESGVQSAPIAINEEEAKKPVVRKEPAEREAAQTGQKRA